MRQATHAGAGAGDVALDHLGLHVGWGVVFSTLLYGSLTVVPAVFTDQGPRWSSLGSLGAFAYLVPAAVGAGAAATGAGLLRLPALRQLGRRAGWQRWPVAGLLLASAALFVVPLLPVFGLLWLAEDSGHQTASVTLVVCLPFLASYVAATYRLRQRLTAPGRRWPAA